MTAQTVENTCEIVQDAAGLYVPAGLGRFSTKADAMETACRAGFRYVVGSGTYWPTSKEPKAIPEYIRARARKGTPWASS